MSFAQQIFYSGGKRGSVVFDRAPVVLEIPIQVGPLISPLQTSTISFPFGSLPFQPGTECRIPSTNLPVRPRRRPQPS